MRKADADIIAQAYAKPDPHPFYFPVGSVIRIKKGVSDDGQTSVWWDGAFVQVMSHYCTGIHKEHLYKVRHLERPMTAEFREDEFDQRYAKKEVGG